MVAALRGRFARRIAAKHNLWPYLAELVGTLRWKVAAVMVLSILISLTEGISLVMLVPMLQIVGLDVGHGTVGQISTLASGFLGTIGLQPTLGTILVFYILIVTMRAFLSSYSTVLGFTLQQQFVVRLRQRLYHAITNADWLFFSRSRTSDFSHALTSELNRVGGATSTLLELFTSIILTLAYLGLALLISPLMTLLVIFAGAILLLALYRKTQLGRLQGKEVTQNYKGMYAAVSEHISGMKVSKSHGIEAEQASIFLRIIDKLSRAHIGIVKNRAEVGFWFQAGAVVILAAILYISLEVVGLSAAGVLLLIFLFSRLIPRFSSLQSGYQSFLIDQAAFENIIDLEMRCRAAAEPETRQTEPIGLHRAIYFQNVSFGYGKDRGPILHELSLTIEAGKTTAIVGPSGAGKSTLVDLAVGLVSPTKGAILIDDMPLGVESLRAWRNQLGYVAQDTFLFHDTVRANLLVTRPEASEEEINQVLQEAAAEFITALPEGLDTVVGERGVRLSGGERQRLALARALLRRPSLLVLDEATSSLDTENEKRIQEAIDRLRGKMTILVVAHRLSTIRNVDIIHVLEGGQLVESGDWNTLVGQDNGRFQALCRAQGLIS